MSPEAADGEGGGRGGSDGDAGGGVGSSGGDSSPWYMGDTRGRRGGARGGTRGGCRYPFELVVQVLAATEGGAGAGGSGARMEGQVETYFDGVLHGTTAVHSGPTASVGSVGASSAGSLGGKGGSHGSRGARAGGGGVEPTMAITKPLLYLDPQLKLSFVVYRRKAVRGIIDIPLSHLIDDLLGGSGGEGGGGGATEYEFPLQNASKRYLLVRLELKRRRLFRVERAPPRTYTATSTPSSSSSSPACQQQQQALSSRLRELAVSLSLGMGGGGGGGGGGVLSEAQRLLSDGAPFLSEQDLADVLTDLRQLQGEGELGRLLNVLQLQGVESGGLGGGGAGGFGFGGGGDQASTELARVRDMLHYAPRQRLEGAYCSVGSLFRGTLLMHQQAALWAGRPLLLPQQQQQKKKKDRGVAGCENSFEALLVRVDEANQRTARLLPSLRRPPPSLPSLLGTTGGTSAGSSSSSSLSSPTQAQLAQELTLYCSDGSAHALVWPRYYDYLQMLKLLCVMRFDSLYAPPAHTQQQPHALYDYCADVLYDNESRSTASTSGDGGRGGDCYYVRVEVRVDTEAGCFVLTAPSGFQQLRSHAQQQQFKTISFDEVRPEPAKSLP